jgi:hypothetical protein
MKFSQYTLGFIVALGSLFPAALVLDQPEGWAYSHNVTCEAGRNACSGQDDEAKPVVWDRSCVLFYLDEAGSEDFAPRPNGIAHPALEQIVHDSFGAWSEPECSGLNLIYGGVKDSKNQIPGERRNLVTFEQEGWPQSSAMTFATTVVNYNPQTGTIREADIKVNDQFYRYATQSSPGPGEADLKNTLTHEVGHFLGMAHSQVADATMHGEAALGETKKRTLHRDDIDGLCAAYPADEYTGTCGQSGSEDQGHDGGRDSFNWGGDSERQSESASACSVTSPAGSAMMNPMIFIVGLFGGVLWRRRSRRNSVD